MYMYMYVHVQMPIVYLHGLKVNSCYHNASIAWKHINKSANVETMLCGENPNVHVHVRVCYVVLSV